MKKRDAPIMHSLLTLPVAVAALLVAAWLSEAAVQAQGPWRTPYGTSRGYKMVKPKASWSYQGMGIYGTAGIVPLPGSPGYPLAYGPWPCASVSVTAGQFWVFYPLDLDDPENPTLYLADPYQVPRIVVWSCGEDPDPSSTQVTLTRPDGSADSFTPKRRGDKPPYAYIYEFQPDSQVGVYTASALNQSGTVTHSYTLSEYPGPRIQLGEGQALEITYRGFGSRPPVQACLYQHVDEYGAERRRLASWPVMAQQEEVQGEVIYHEIRPIDDLEVESYGYLLIATADDFVSCPPTLNEEVVSHFLWKEVAYAEFYLESGPEMELGAPGDYFNLQWAPGCDPTQPLALLSPGQGGCGEQTERRDLAWLVDELRQQGLLAEDEWLVQVALGGATGRRDLQGLAIHNQTSAQLGWIRVGGGLPGSVWRTNYYPPGSQVGSRCWLRTDYTWSCQ